METRHKELEALTIDKNQPKQAVLYFGLKNHFEQYFEKYKKAMVDVLRFEKRQQDLLREKS